jgi:hypothetical protein
MDAAKKKSLSPAGLTALRVLLLLVVGLCLGQTRVWGLDAAPHHASGQIAVASASAVGEIAPAVAYDVSECPVAADTAGLATTPLNQTVTGVSGDALVHFAPQEYSTIQPGAGGQVFSFQYGDVSHLTPRQIETVIGPLSVGGQTGGASVMHVLDAPIESAVQTPGAVVRGIPEYIFDTQVPTSGAFKVQ